MLKIFRFINRSQKKQIITLTNAQQYSLAMEIQGHKHNIKRKRSIKKWIINIKAEPYFAFIVSFAIIAIILPIPTLLLWPNGIKSLIINILPNLFASCIDIILLGILVTIISKRQQISANLARWKEEINDYRGWNEPEAMYRIMGNIKRLLALREKKLDLENCYLNHANLSYANLEEANFRAASLCDACLFDAILKGANLQGAKLTNSDLSHANFEGADLYAADLSQSDLGCANFQEANLHGTNLKGADLHQANLNQAILAYANLKEANLYNINNLFAAISFYRTKFDNEILNKIKSNCPEKLATIWVPNMCKWIIDHNILAEIQKEDWPGWQDEENEPRFQVAIQNRNIGDNTFNAFL